MADLRGARVPAGTRAGGQFSSVSLSEVDVELKTSSDIFTLFPNPDDAERAAEFEFSWHYMDFDEYNGYTAYDPDEPLMRNTRVDAVQVGDEVLVPNTTSVYKQAVKVARYVGGLNDGQAAVWLDGQDPSTDPPAVLAHGSDHVSICPARPASDLSTPEGFNRELARRVYEETASQASRADESHDVERIANQVTPGMAEELAREALRTD